MTSVEDINLLLGNKKFPPSVRTDEYGMPVFDQVKDAKFLEKVAKSLLTEF